ncbi:unnamed protein product, partial [Rotaria magnacalcarata]
KEELTKSTNENNRLRKTINSDETTHLKANFKKILEEYEKIKLVNKNLLQQCQQQTSSPKQVS